MFVRTNKSKLLNIVLLTLTLLILKVPNALAVETILEDDFSNNTIETTLWDNTYYLWEKFGSESNFGQLNLIESNQEIQINGTGTLGAIYLPAYNNIVGWLGKSLISNQSYNPNTNKVVLSTDIKFDQMTSGTMSHLTIEFDKFNRIILSIGTFIGGGISNLLFDENDVHRGIGGPNEIENTSGWLNLPFITETGRTYHLSMEYFPSTKIIKGYIDQLLIHEGTYNGTTSNFRVGFGSTVREVGDNVDAKFDNFKLTVDELNPIFTPTPTPTQIPINILNVPDIKQFSSPWGESEYDSASIWSPSDPTMTRWACALTSASMILNYYGFPSTPETLNHWLKIQPDGYTKNGGIMWPAISRYSKTKKQNQNLPTLEFAYKPVNMQSLISDLGNGLPHILKFQKLSGATHFGVAKGTFGEEVIVNDPALYNADPTLEGTSQTWGDLVKTGLFTPSNTDLSYIVLLINEGFNIKIFDKEGNEIQTENAFEGPLNSNDQTGVSGINLNSFYFSKPDSGYYILEITGDGDYEIISYLYDVNGNVKFTSMLDTIFDGNKDRFAVYLNKPDVVDSHSTPITLVSLVEDWTDTIQDGKVSQNGLNRSISNLFNNALKTNNKNNVDSTKSLLLEALIRIKIASPLFIDAASANYYIIKITNLLEII